MTVWASAGRNSSSRATKRPAPAPVHVQENIGWVTAQSARPRPARLRPKRKTSNTPIPEPNSRARLYHQLAVNHRAMAWIFVESTALFDPSRHEKAIESPRRPARKRQRRGEPHGPTHDDRRGPAVEFGGPDRIGRKLFQRRVGPVEMVLALLALQRADAIDQPPAGLEQPRRMRQH